MSTDKKIDWNEVFFNPTNLAPIEIPVLFDVGDEPAWATCEPEEPEDPFYETGPDLSWVDTLEVDEVVRVRERWQLATKVAHACRDARNEHANIVKNGVVTPPVGRFARLFGPLPPYVFDMQ